MTLREVCKALLLKSMTGVSTKRIAFGRVWRMQ